MMVREARFLNYKEGPEWVKIRNRARKTVFLGIDPDVTVENGYPVFPGEVLKLDKSIPLLYVVK